MLSFIDFTYFGSYLISDRRSAFRSIVRRIVSVSESLWTMFGFNWLRFDSSKARNASCVNACVCCVFVFRTADGNSWRTAEFGLNELWNNVECFFTVSVSDVSVSVTLTALPFGSPLFDSPSHTSWSISVVCSLPLPSMKRTERFEVSSSDVALDVVSSLWNLPFRQLAKFNYKEIHFKKIMLKS